MTKLNQWQCDYCKNIFPIDIKESYYLRLQLNPKYFSTESYNVDMEDICEKCYKEIITGLEKVFALYSSKQ